MKKTILYLMFIILTSCHTEKKQARQVEDLLETDRAFSSMSEDVGMKKAFIHFCAPEGVLLRENAMPIVGHSTIVEYLSGINDEAIILSWEPLHATVAKSGDLGYTYGIFQLKIKESDELEKGTYVSIWTREGQSWKWVLDTGNNGLGE